MRHYRQVKDVQLEELLADALNSLPRDLQAEINRRIDEDTSGKYFPALINQVVSETASITGKQLVETLNFSKIVKQRKKDRRKLNKHLKHHWRPALEYLEGMIHGFWEYSVLFYREAESHKGSETDHFFLATVRIQARACRIANEILTLLKNGLCDGAMGRWRTLYELSVISNFIGDNGQETAERYLAHEHLQRIKHVEAFHNQEIRTQGNPLTDDELAELYEEKTHLLDMYGEDFSGDFGWAAKAINMRRPTFSHIESAIDLSTARPLYRRASADVHGGADGLRGSGLIDEYEDELVAGPSTAGLGEPGGLTAQALAFLATVPLVCYPTLERLVWASAFKEIADLCTQAFDECESALYEENVLLYESGTANHDHIPD